MMNVVILDTGCANLFSISAALHRLGYQSTTSHNTEIVLQADKLFLPGVGTAQVAMDKLRKWDLIDLIKEYTRPVLGICLGMQLLGTDSDENSGVKTLGIIDAPVERMTAFDLPLPHMGWNRVTIQASNHLFHEITDGSYFYFAHNYAIPLCAATIAQANYGKPFTAAVKWDNFFGVQFHPERSGSCGSQLLKNFLEM
ncbi:MAG: imidazole glycerol phosphate synthase subunit HisH [Sodalis sp. Ffu]|nr:MAG: imidazole glycerol phosphate synthase subunit HisH [Sodalis sp. Ffu]